MSFEQDKLDDECPKFITIGQKNQLFECQKYSETHKKVDVNQERADQLKIGFDAQTVFGEINLGFGNCKVKTNDENDQLSMLISLVLLSILIVVFILYKKRLPQKVKDKLFSLSSSMNLQISQSQQPPEEDNITDSYRKQFEILRRFLHICKDQRIIKAHNKKAPKNLQIFKKDIKRIQDWVNQNSEYFEPSSSDEDSFRNLEKFTTDDYQKVQWFIHSNFE